MLSDITTLERGTICSTPKVRAGLAPQKYVFPALTEFGGNASVTPLGELLVALRNASDKVGNDVFSSTRKLMGVAERKILPATIEQAYNNKQLAGGGVKSLNEKCHKCVYFCSNDKLNADGSPVCQKLQPDGYKPGSQCHYRCGSEVSPFMDRIIDLREFYECLLVDLDLAQRIVDYHPISLARLSTPLEDLTARVKCVESGWIARRDYTANPDNFRLEIVPKEEEVAFLPVKGSKLEPVYVRRIEGTRATVLKENGEKLVVDLEVLQKIGGHMAINVSAFEDGISYYHGTSIMYNNDGLTEQIENIAKHHRRRPELCALLKVTAGGFQHKNVQERQVYPELQRRKLQDAGFELRTPITVQHEGVERTIHSLHVVRNEYHKTLDHPAAVKASNGVGGRALASLNRWLEGFEAHGTCKRAIYSFVMNFSTSNPRQEASSMALCDAAHKLSGTNLNKKSFEAAHKLSGIKGTTVEYAGSAHHNLGPDATRAPWARIEFERLHMLAIITKTFKKLMLTMMKKKVREVLLSSHKALRQSRGAKRIKTYVKRDKTKINASFAGEKLHESDHWRSHRMLFDLCPCFSDGSEKSTDALRVRGPAVVVVV